MGKTKDLGHLAHIVAYDAENHITVPAGITMHTNQLVASQSWVTTQLGSYALSSSLGSYVPTSRTITINGTSYDLSANRSWDITSMIYPDAGIPLSTGSAWGTSIANNSANWNTAYGWGNHASAGYLTGITSTLVTNALGFTPYNATNPNGYITGITSSNVTTALGFTPVTNARTITINGTAYDLTANREWTVSGTDSTKLPLAGGTMTGSIEMATSGTSYIRMGRFPNVTTNSGEAWIGRASDRSTGTMTVQLGSSNSSVFEVVDYGWTTVTLKVGMNDFTYKGNAVIHAGNIGSQSVSLSSQVSINYNNDSNSTYQLLWGSGNSVYGTAQVYVNPSSDVIYARGGYISPGNPWGTSDSAYFPNGITTAGGTNWVYGNTYIGNAPGNGSGVNIASAGSSYFRSSNTAGTWGYAGLFVDRNNGANNYIPWSFESEYGNHSWGIVARFHIQQSGADRPSIQFSSAGGNDRWSVGYCTASDWNFRITQNQGYRTDNSTNDGWGTERFRINTDGNTYAAIGGTLYANGTQVVTNNGGTWGINISGSASSASSAGYANHLPTHYVGGAQGNPQVYFNNGIGLKAAMTGAWSVWSDTLWINGYSGGDVPWMCALHFLRNSEPRFAISAQTHTGAGYGSYYEVITAYNIASQTVSTANNLSGFDKTNPSFGAVYANNWFRPQGDCGMYTQDYGGHIRRTVNASHGTWEIFGYNKNGYAGLNIQDPQGYYNNYMHESGNGGLYSQNYRGDWVWYHNAGQNCTSFNGSTTDGGVRFRVNGSMRVTSDFNPQGYTGFGGNVEWPIGYTQYHGTNTAYNWRDWGGWGGYWWSRNGGDMIMNLYALYSVTGSISDIRYKKDVEALPYGLNEIMQLNPIKYHYNLPKESMLSNDPDYFLGFSAQEVQALIPEAVHEKVNEDVESLKGMLAITYDELIPVTVQAIKEQQVMIHNQNIRIQKLEALVTQLLNN